MLTRVEIDGFKSFENFSIDLPPFAVVVGANASGKSNFFDALRLISRLAEADFSEAARAVRGRPHELFRLHADGTRSPRMNFAVEVLMDRDIIDTFSVSHKLKSNRVRYEIGLAMQKDDASPIERVVVVHEQAQLIERDKDRLFRDRRIKPAVIEALREWAPARRNIRDLIKPVEWEGQPAIEIRQDGAGGRKMHAPLGKSSRTWLASVGTPEQALHLYALQSELRAIAFLHLDPAAAAEAVDLVSSDVLATNGANLAHVIVRLVADTATSDRPDGVLSDIRQELRALIPEIADIRVDHNKAARKYELFARLRDKTEFDARLLSDGTLRLLTLITALYDGRRRGVLCFEEPENGLHEARIPQLINLLRRFTTDLAAPPQDGEKLSQIIVNSHSPIVLQHLEPEEVIAADMVEATLRPQGNGTRRTRMRAGMADELPLDDPNIEGKLSRVATFRLLRRQSEQAS